MRRLLHWLGLHDWRHIWGRHNEYFECAQCQARMVRLGRGGHQPVDSAWLYHRDRWPSVGRPPPMGGWDGVVIPKPLPEIAAETRQPAPMPEPIKPVKLIG